MKLDATFHSFRTHIAEEYGMTAAVILEGIHYWVEKNKANERNFHDGRYWSYNSIKAYNAMYPYLSEKQIRTTLAKLEEAGVILSGCYNDDPHDRTKWYALTDKGHDLFRVFPKVRLDLPSGANGNCPKVDCNNQYNNTIAMGEDKACISTVTNETVNTPYQSVTSSAIGLSKADITPKQSPYTNTNTKQAEEVTSCLSPKGERTSGATPEAIQKAYNEICKSLPKCKVLTEKRRKAIKARLAEGITEEDFTEIFHNAENSDFLKGGGRQGFVANFDFLIGDKAVKVLENTYANADRIQAEACMRKYMLTDEEFDELFPLDEEDKNGSD